jgi:hypothetical protein
MNSKSGTRDGDGTHNGVPRNENGQRVCGARKRDGSRCQGTILYPNGRCKKHGGPTPGGLASPHFKHGKRSLDRYVPKGILVAYREALRDPELVSMRRGLALLDGRTVELLKRMGETEAPPWGQAVEALNDFKTAQTDERRRLALENLETVIRTGANASASYDSTWHELREVIQERTKVATAESRRLHEADQVLTKEQAAALGYLVMQAVRAAVLDEATFAKGPLAVLRKAQDGLRRALEGTAPAREVIEGDTAEGEPPSG